MTTKESQALYTLASFLLGPCKQQVFYMESLGGVPEITQSEALESLEYLASRINPLSGVYRHQSDELREKWNARFRQIKCKEIGK